MLSSIISGWAPIGLPTRRSAVVCTLIVAIACLLAASSPAHASSLAVQHDSYAATLTQDADADGIIGPGDSFTLQEYVHSSETDSNGAVTLTNVSGTLSSADGTANVDPLYATSAYPDLAFNVSTANTTPFHLSVPSGADCGIGLPLSLALSAQKDGQPGQATIPFTVTTGATGAFVGFNSSQVPLAIPSTGSIFSTLTVSQAGRVKGVRVRIGSITHPYDGDLRIQLISPDGTSVTLIDSNLSNNGHNFTNTVFDQSASTPITSASAPYTGTFRPQGDLSAFNGKQQQGTWELEVTAVSPGQTGLLNSWGADVAKAVCTGNPLGSITASPNPVLPNGTVTFDGSGSRAPSPGATITKYEWNPDVVNTPNNWVSTGTTSSWTHAYSARGQYTGALRVTDSNNQVSTPITTNVSVTQPPVAAISAPGSPVAASPVTFDASGSTHDPAGSIVDYRWDLDGSGNYATDTGNVPSVTTTYPTARTVFVHVRVTDDTGASSVAGQNVTIADAPPTASFSFAGPVLVGQPVTFNGSASHDPDGTISDYRWDLAGAGTYGTDSGTSSSVSTTYSSPGLVNVGLKVTDNAGLTGTVTHGVQVTRPPVARLTATPNPASAGQQVTLDASGSSDPDGVIANYSWDLDGSGRYATNGGSTSFLVHAFPSPGSYPVAVRVTDNYGATATASLTLTVNPAAGGGGSASGGSSLSPSGQLNHPFGGNPTAGIASLSGSDLKAIIPGSDNHFATITGDAVRRARVVASKGLWLNALSDRPASFQVSVAVSAADAQKLKLIKRGRHAGRKQAALVGVGSGSLNLSAAGQKPFDVAIGGPARTALRRTHRAVKLLVMGTASDGAGHRTSLGRVFLVKR
jgi:subtilisin-like proprotein convertase family protein